MFTGCFVPFVLDNFGTKSLAVGDVVSSDEFSAGGHLWVIDCYPHGCKTAANKGEYVSLFFRLIKSRSSSVKAFIEGYVVNREGEPRDCEKKRTDIHEFKCNGDDWGWLVCNDGEGIEDPPFVVPPPKIGEHLGRLLDSADGSDVSFVVGGETFPAHRAVLAARSPVFKAELFGCMAEATSSCITLHEIEPVTFRALLRFIYTDDLREDIDKLDGSPVDTTFHHDLLAMADRYELDGLKLLCARRLLCNMTANSVADTLVCNETYNCPEMKIKCMDFFAVDDNFKKAAFSDVFFFHANMFTGCFVPFVLDYSVTKSLAVGDVVSSGDISAGGHHWVIDCYPHGITTKKAEEKGKYVSLYLRIKSKCSGVKAMFEAFVLTKDGEPSTSDSPWAPVHEFQGKDGNDDWGWSEFMSRDDLEEKYVTATGRVTFICGIAVMRHDGGQENSMYIASPSKVGEDLGGLLDSADGSDVSFIVDGETFSAHRAVLAARSPVFKAELFGCMSEATLSCITLHDIEPATFRALLRFIYTDELPEDTGKLDGSPIDTTFHHDLLAVADRYALDGLKLLCARWLLCNMTTDSVNLVAGDVVMSDDISAGGHLWKIECYPRSKSTTSTVKAIFHSSVLTRDGQPLSIDDERTELQEFERNDEEWGLSNFVKRVDLEENCVTDSGHVTFLCGIAVVIDPLLIVVPPPDIGTHLGRLLDKIEGTDVTFVVGGETFPAHRAVVAARSPVFKAELFGSMSESNSSIITLQDIEPATFSALLRFMYTDDMPDDTDELEQVSMTDTLQHLLAASDRYGLDRLKLMCAQRLLHCMTVDSVADILACAEMYNCPELKNKCIDFFVAENNFKKDVFTDGTTKLAAGDVISSDDISFGGHVWKIDCYPRGTLMAAKKRNCVVSLFLRMKSKSNAVKAFFEASAMNREGHRPIRGGSRKTDVYEFKGNNGDHGYGLGWHDFMYQDSMCNAVTASGHVTLVCRISIIVDPLLVLPPSNIGENFGHLLDDGAYGTDVTFFVGGEKFPAHRVILAARSPVFKAELFGSMSESTSSCITLQDIEPETFRDLLRFIYTDQLPGVTDGPDGFPADTFQDLLVVADRYALDRLKLLCAHKLAHNMTADTVADILDCAETYNCPGLKNKCMDFLTVKDNFNQAVFTQGYARLLQKYPLVAAEMKTRAAASGDMPNSGFIELNLDYAATNEFLSDAFTAGGHTWVLKCYPRGREEVKGEYLSLFLGLVSSKSKNVMAIFDAFVLGKGGERYSFIPARSSMIFSPIGPPNGLQAWGWLRFVKRSDLESLYMVDGKFRIMCVVIVLRDNDPIQGFPLPLPLSVPPSDIGVHLGGMLDRGVGTDVTFLVDGETFPAHRVVLAARSLVFETELYGSMMEANMSCITLHDIEPDTFRAMLRFIYTDTLLVDGVELMTTAMTTELFYKLLAAADRYGLNRLKCMCAQKLWETVSVDTVAKMLVHAEMHSCPELKRRCLDFFVQDKNFKEAVLTDGLEAVRMSSMNMAPASGFLELKLDFSATNACATGDIFTTDVFSAGGFDWSVEYFPRGYGKNGINGAYLSLFLKLVSKSKNIKAIFDAFLMEKDGEPSSYVAKRLVHVFPPEGGYISWGWLKFVKRSDLESSYVVDGKVRIMCVVIVLRDNDNHVPVSSSDVTGRLDGLPVPPSDIGVHLGHLLDSGDGTDVSFIVNGEKFAAHRAVLAARSPVFKAELFGCMSESTSSCITLNDIEPAIFRALLWFIYTDELPGDTSKTNVFFQHLLAVADRYALDRLKLMCAQRLLHNVTADTVTDILVCAETYNCPELKNKCIDFFAVEDNFRKAVFTDGFALLVQEFPLIVAELQKRLRPSIRMATTSGYVDLKVDYSATKACAIGDVFFSDAFTAGGHTWRVTYYPRGDKKENNNGDHFSLFLKLDSKSKDVKAIFDAFLMDKDGKPLLLLPRDACSERDLESSYVVDGKFRIMCVVIVLHDDRAPVPSSDIGVHLGRLLDSSDGADVSFMVDGETFPAHRAVLAARSPVFKAELFGSMVESKMSCITLHDIEPETFRSLLQFIYTDELPEDCTELEGSSSTTTARDELFKKLLAAADRYDLSRLKLMCEQKLSETVSVDNVLPMLVFAEMHNCPDLKRRCLDFVLAEKNFEEALVSLNMLASGFIEYKLNYLQTQKLAIEEEWLPRTRISAGEHNGTIMCYPRGRVGYKGEHISLFLTLNQIDPKFTVVFDVFLIGRDGKPSSKYGQRSGDVIESSGGSRYIGWNRFVKRSDLDPDFVADDGTVTFVCGLIVLRSDDPIIVPPSNLGGQLGAMVCSTDGSDVSFNVGGETFHAHRAVLAARSPVFRAELFGSMVEATMPCITLRDIESLTFKALLHFVYTDELSSLLNSVDLLQGLLAAADRYALDRLKLMCAKKLWELTSVETVAAIIVCAETYNCTELKRRCLDFFMAKDNFNKVVVTKGYFHLGHSSPAIIEEIKARLENLKLKP
uniref:BTB domain-containing protein n=1 Tax=Leersia perrieri TaxID=77586 RepID=A0A0D9X9Y2_9ORYZ